MCMVIEAHLKATKNQAHVQITVKKCCISSLSATTVLSFATLHK